MERLQSSPLFRRVIRTQMLMNYGNSWQLAYNIGDNQQLAYAIGGNQKGCVPLWIAVCGA